MIALAISAAVGLAVVWILPDRPLSPVGVALLAATVAAVCLAHLLRL